MRRSVLLLLAAVLQVSLAVCWAQAQKAPNPIPLTLTARLNAAKTAFIKNGGGGDIPVKVVQSTMEGWGRYALVENPEKADLIIEMSAEDDSGVTVSSKSTTSPLTGMPEQSTATSRKLSGGPVKMVVYEAKTNRALWSGTEKPKFAMKQTARENNLVDATEKLVAKFRARVEGAPTP